MLAVIDLNTSKGLSHGWLTFYDDTLSGGGTISLKVKDRPIHDCIEVGILVAYVKVEGTYPDVDIGVKYGVLLEGLLKGLILITFSIG